QKAIHPLEQRFLHFAGRQCHGADHPTTTGTTYPMMFPMKSHTTVTSPSQTSVTYIQAPHTGRMVDPAAVRIPQSSKVPRPGIWRTFWLQHSGPLASVL
ncbi:hypothetical protein NDU88_006400, partial [Pleurodeles waltl]